METAAEPTTAAPARNIPLKPLFKKSDRAAAVFIWTVSAVVFLAVAVLSRVRLDWQPGFDVHVFALANAFINSTVSLLLVAALWAVRTRRLLLHRNLMYGAIVLSVLFLVSYIFHHLLSESTSYGGAGAMKAVYYTILVSHILLAGIILPFILYTAYRALTADYGRHKKLARITYPIWLYVSLTGVAVYLMISPYYGA